MRHAPPIAALLLAVSVHAQDPLPADALGVPYAPAERANPPAEAVCSVWLPEGTPPASGWPVILWNSSGGYLRTTPLVQLTETQQKHAIPLNALANGIAVVNFGLVDGRSPARLFFPPGDPSGRWEDLSVDMQEKCTLWVLQWAKTQTQFAFDPELCGFLGYSSGAHLGDFVAALPEQADPNAAPGSQLAASSRAGFVLSMRGIFWHPAFDLDVPLTPHWPTVTGAPAPTPGDIAPGIFEATSPAYWLAQPGSNALTTPIYGAYEVTVYKDVIGPPDYSTDASGVPAITDLLLDTHDSWHGYMRMQELLARAPALHGKRSRLAVEQNVPVTAGTNQGLEHFLFAGPVEVATQDDVVPWIRSLRVRAAFTPDRTRGRAPLRVAFTDESAGDATTWSWSFGDGGVSSASDPVHVFEDPGTYSVTLTITAPDGSDAITRTDLVTAEAGRVRPAPGPLDATAQAGVGPSLRLLPAREAGDRMVELDAHRTSAAPGAIPLLLVTLEGPTREHLVAVHAGMPWSGVGSVALPLELGDELPPEARLFIRGVLAEVGRPALPGPVMILETTQRRPRALQNGVAGGR